MTVYLNQLGIVSPLGNDHASVLAALISGERGLSVCDDFLALPTYLGKCAEQQPLPLHLAEFESRNNRQLYAAAQQIAPMIDAAIAQFGAERIAVIIGSSTSGVAQSEPAFISLVNQGELGRDFEYGRQEMADPARFLAAALAINGPAFVVSTACSSSARALMSAKRLLEMGVVDAVLCGGADSLCRLTVNGFAALESLSFAECQPFSRNRSGINIGEAAVLFLLSQKPSAVALMGCGASSDAHHISAPQPDGRGAIAAMQAALQDAQLMPADIDYLNLHGTATPLNDLMESRAVVAVFNGVSPPSSSTKALTGHTLGAAGALEAAFCWLLLQNKEGQLPPQINDGAVDPALSVMNFPQAGHVYRPKIVMSNSFAFGGNNVSLILASQTAAEDKLK